MRRHPGLREQRGVPLIAAACRPPGQPVPEQAHRRHSQHDFCAALTRQSLTIPATSNSAFSRAIARRYRWREASTEMPSFFAASACLSWS